VPNFKVLSRNLPENSKETAKISVKIVGSQPRGGYLPNESLERLRTSF
jgi:hypothetical protein